MHVCGRPRLRPRTQADAEPLNALRNGLFKMVVEQLGRTNDLLSEKLRHRELRLRDELGGTLRALASQLHALRGSADKEISRVRAQYEQDKAEVIRDAKRESLVRGPCWMLVGSNVMLLVCVISHHALSSDWAEQTTDPPRPATATAFAAVAVAGQTHLSLGVVWAGPASPLHSMIQRPLDVLLLSRPPTWWTLGFGVQLAAEALAAAKEAASLMQKRSEEAQKSQLDELLGGMSANKSKKALQAKYSPNS
jgi:hypothetical protein